ncbi:MAG: hypothetical protein FJ297_00020 [Planctomycetes bacterium]|nr:hypothetical protein [Planctomycetota bacterium]
MNLVRGVAAVTLFELRRSRTWWRSGVWALLAFFPVFIVVSLRATGADPPKEAWTFLLYALITEVTTSLGLFLWMSPAIQSELESKTWVYLAVRPYGRRVVLIGKLVTALIWSMSSSLVALTICTPIARPENPARVFGVLVVLSFLSALGRGTAYSVFAVAMPQRAMVFAFVYTLVFEYLVGWIPAVINQFTVQFHVRCLLMNWIRLEGMPSGVRLFFNDAPSWQHLVSLVAYFVLTFGLALIILESREFVSSDEG